MLIVIRIARFNLIYDSASSRLEGAGLVLIDQSVNQRGGKAARVASSGGYIAGTAAG